jgi:ATP-binding cassette subfamily B protein
MLSGGQRQRVALARGLYQGGEVILLDDVLSAVDHENEQRLVKSLSSFNERAQPSCVIVSNRISAFRHANQIIVLDQGTVVQRGTHKELIEQEGVYKEAYLAQKDATEDRTSSREVVNAPA